jgi:hypothetical protein
MKIPLYTAVRRFALTPSAATAMQVLHTPTGLSLTVSVSIWQSTVPSSYCVDTRSTESMFMTYVSSGPALFHKFAVKLDGSPVNLVSTYSPTVATQHRPSWHVTVPECVCTTSQLKLTVQV